MGAADKGRFRPRAPRVVGALLFRFGGFTLLYQRRNKSGRRWNARETRKQRRLPPFSTQTKTNA